ncbi:MAG: hypothetical protein OHK0015_44410 [Chloroflexi bacterium OHK40]
MTPGRLPLRLERMLTSPTKGFGPAVPGERTVYGARRPGFPLPRPSPAIVSSWILAVQAAEIRWVLCLLPPRQLRGYDGLLDAYRNVFGAEAVCWAPIADFQLADQATLTGTILPFLFAADGRGERVVVHCSGGIGRTGHVLAAWLVSARGLSNADAIEAVRRTGRNPREACDRNLDALLDACRAYRRDTGS